jgi:hypothetical protein
MARGAATVKLAKFRSMRDFSRTAEPGGHSQKGKAGNRLLFKGRDEAANDKLDIITAKPESVLSGRTVDEIAAAADRVWQTSRPAAPTVAEKRAAKIAAARPRAALPANHNELVSLVEQLPLGFKLTSLTPTFTTETVPRRLVTLREDPWASMTGLKQSITASAWRAFGGKR